jgi:hypothetical protein
MTHRHPPADDQPRAGAATGCARAAVESDRGASRPPASDPHEPPPSSLATTLESAVAIVSIAVVGLVSAAINAAPV